MARKTKKPHSLAERLDAPTRRLSAYERHEVIQMIGRALHHILNDRAELERRFISSMAVDLHRNHGADI